MTPTTLPDALRPLLQPRLPQWVEARWFANKQEALVMARNSEIGWFDMPNLDDRAQVISSATQLKWLNSLFAGVDRIPLQLLAQRKVLFTHGAGINADAIAEYVIMGMLTMSKGYRDVVRAQDRHEWLSDSPGKRELCGSRALIIGHGFNGRAISTRLAAFNVQVGTVRRTSAAGALHADQWRARLHEFDWIIVAAPETAETIGMIGARELAQMKPTAVIVNISRGSIIDQAALLAALQERQIGGALLDVTTPEPLSPDHPLWALDNCHITMHLSGRAQNKMLERGAERFLQNLVRYREGQPLQPVVNLALGY